jgi:hypothetical protein
LAIGQRTIPGAPLAVLLLRIHAVLMEAFTIRVHVELEDCRCSVSSKVTKAQKFRRC